MVSPRAEINDAVNRECIESFERSVLSWCFRWTNACSSR